MECSFGEAKHLICFGSSMVTLSGGFEVAIELLYQGHVLGWSFQAEFGCYLSGRKSYIEYFCSFYRSGLFYIFESLIPFAK